MSPICVNALRLNMCLGDPSEHGWREDESVECSKNCFSVNIDYVLINYQNLKNHENDNSINNEDFSESIGSEF